MDTYIVKDKNRKIIFVMWVAHRETLVSETFLFIFKEIPRLIIK